ncbi:hypothetical protein RE735_17660 [Bacillus aerius]|nr:hypothetical protein [Bacillus aerius]WMT28869.1 hypothetical protein RE735_17660 [Bacillus aerius]
MKDPLMQSQRVDKPSHSVSVLQRFSITLKRRQRAKIKFILALCQQSKTRISGSERNRFFIKP